MQTLLTIIHIFTCIVLVLVVLLQSGRSGGMGAAFGGASSQIFGGRGAGNFLAKVTSTAAIVFFATSLTLSVMSSQHHSVVAGASTDAVKTTTEETSADDGEKHETATISPNAPGDGDQPAAEATPPEGDAAEIQGAGDAPPTPTSEEKEGSKNPRPR